jgi:hypothetical protein
MSEVIEGKGDDMGDFRGSGGSVARKGDDKGDFARTIGFGTTDEHR